MNTFYLNISVVEVQQEIDDYFDKDFDEKKNYKESELIDKLMKDKELKKDDRSEYKINIRRIDDIDKNKLKHETNQTIIDAWLKKRDELVERNNQYMLNGITPKTPIRCATAGGKGSDIDQWKECKNLLVKKIKRLCINERIVEVSTS